MESFFLEYVLLLIAECPVSYLRQNAPCSYPSFEFLILSWLLLRIRERRKHGILCRGSRMLERRRKSVFVMCLDRLAARLEREEAVLGDSCMLDHNESILINDGNWKGARHVLLNIHCEK